MKSSTETVMQPVSAEEVARRIAEYSHMAYETKARPCVVYSGPWVLCPWVGCGLKIGAIDFRLEADYRDQYAAFLAAWWQGAGLTGRCAGCHRYVLFTINDKQCVTDPEAIGLTVLPDDWFERAYTL